MIFFGVESSCDETAIAIMKDNGEVLSHQLYSQIKQHQLYGGVVPEVAARAHLDIIDILIKISIKEAGITLRDITYFCATSGPGLAGGLIIGSLAAKTLAMVYDKPFLAVNHLQAHALIPTLSDNILFPFLLLLVSGGHTQFVVVRGVNVYQVLGETIDDAIGEAFDKSARCLGLPYPGGKMIQELAKKGDEKAFTFPKPLFKQKNCNFSFAGLKTSFKQKVDTLGNINEKIKQDLCASLQRTIIDIVLDRTISAINMYEAKYGKLYNLVISGGVSANEGLRRDLESFLTSKKISFNAPPTELCTDNAIMIAWAGIQMVKSGREGDSFDFPIKPRWQLADLLKEGV